MELLGPGTSGMTAYMQPILGWWAIMEMIDRMIMPQLNSFVSAAADQVMDDDCKMTVVAIMGAWLARLSGKAIYYYQRTCYHLFLFPPLDQRNALPSAASVLAALASLTVLLVEGCSDDEEHKLNNCADFDTNDDLAAVLCASIVLVTTTVTAAVVWNITVPNVTSMVKVISNETKKASSSKLKEVETARTRGLQRAQDSTK